MAPLAVSCLLAGVAPSTGAWDTAGGGVCRPSVYPVRGAGGDRADVPLGPRLHSASLTEEQVHI